MSEKCSNCKNCKCKGKIEKVDTTTTENDLNLSDESFNNEATDSDSMSKK